MNKASLIKLFKFYKEEQENPFVGKDFMKSKWWEGEKMFLENFRNDPGFFERVKKGLVDGIKEKQVSGFLADESNSIEARTVVFYLDLWNGKWFPYDSLDDIFDYVKSN